MSSLSQRVKDLFAAHLRTTGQRAQQVGMGKVEQKEADNDDVACIPHPYGGKEFYCGMIVNRLDVESALIVGTFVFEEHEDGG